jgi:DNA polymerase-3 subunit beta
MNTIPDTAETAASAPTARITERALCELIDRALVAAPRDRDDDPARYPVLIEGEPHQVRMVATDGHRIATVARDCTGPGLPPRLLVRPKHLADLRKQLRARSHADVTLALTDAGLAVEGAADRVLPLERDATFPPHQRMLPWPAVTVEVRCGDLLAALRRIAEFADRRNPGFRPVRLEVGSGRLTVSVPHPSPAVPTATVPVTYNPVTYNGEAFTIGVNARYLIDALRLQASRDTIVLGLTDERSPAIIWGLRDPGFTYAVMPMML